MSEQAPTPRDGGPANTFADPVVLAATVATSRRPLLVGLDIDGVLAPIASHADHAEMLPGMLDAVAALAALTPVAVVTGRRLADAVRFEIPAGIAVFGSHGLERRGAPPLVLSDVEQTRHDRLREIAEEVAETTGPGAWVEVKAASVVLHVRQVPPEAGAAALTEVERRARGLTGVHVKEGKLVAELLARATSKADAVQTLREEFAAATVAYVGDDDTDEEVFATLRDGDVGIRVGLGETRALARLTDPTAVLVFVQTLTTALV